MHTVEFYNEAEDVFQAGDNLVSFVKECLSHIKPSFPLSMTVTVTDNENIHQVNLEQRGIDKPTDVLSFPMLFFKEPEVPEELTELDYDPETNQVVLGDLLISYEKILEQAEEYGHSKERELCYLTLHGILHLFGYDHMTDEDKKVMRQREEEILALCNAAER
ncbi:MAG: rRNA maturation RNase YbeY [Clostridia bacterium]|nr:rRNA maturation RNase YbeY [Clostridia bacterium]